MVESIFAAVLGVDAAAITIRGLREPATVLGVVVFAEEDRAAIVAESRGAVDRAGNNDRAEPLSFCRRKRHGQPAERLGVVQEILL